MASKADSVDSRCVAHHMNDDPNAADLEEDRYRAWASAATRDILDACEALWADDLEKGAHHTRGGSVYAGACGAAALLYKLASIQQRLQGDKDGNDERTAMFGRPTELMLRAALGHCKSGSAAMGAGRSETTRVTFLEGEAGCHALSAAILSALGKEDAAASSVERLCAMAPRVAAMPPDECELMYGRCGYLHALLFARTKVSPPVARALLPPSAFHDIIRQVVTEGARGAAAEKSRAVDPDAATTWGLAHSWREKRYLGCAHGEAGVALTLLQCEAELGWQDGECWGGIAPHGVPMVDGVPVTSRVRDAVAALTGACLDDGNLPSSVTSTSGGVLVQWCHGAPGLIPLLARAVRHAGPSAAPARLYAAPLRRAAEVTWRRGLLKKGPGLCHGASGNGYALLSAYRATRDAKQLARARRFAQWTAKHADALAKRADAPGSMFEGLAGAAAFIADTVDPDASWMPGCEF